MRTRWTPIFVSLLAVLLHGRRADAQVHVYTIEARIDTNDQLRIQGSTLQWYHPGAGAAVGRHGGSNLSTVVSASVDGVMRMDSVGWTPGWPLAPPNEIRFEASSSVFSGLTPALPAFEPVSVDVGVVSGRGSLELLESPTAANGYALVVRYNDGFNGSANLTGSITVTVPEPGACGAAAVILLLTGRRRRFG